MQKVYISGRMSGLARKDYMAVFNKAEELIRARGYKVVNPARLPICRWPWLYRLLGYRIALLTDLYMLMRCDRIYKLPGWRESRGANIEGCTAYHFGVRLMPAEDYTAINAEIMKFMEQHTNILK